MVPAGGDAVRSVGSICGSAHGRSPDTNRHSATISTEADARGGARAGGGGRGVAHVGRVGAGGVAYRGAAYRGAYRGAEREVIPIMNVAASERVDLRDMFISF